MISGLLQNWFIKNKRDLPWRNTNNPYFIWLSEVILQQTRVVQGTPYYLKFIENYPTIFELAAAPEDEILRLWQGLGYYSRARNMHTAAKNIVENQKGVFPNTYKSLILYKGIGKYTASAVASFAFNENVAVLDGNVMRVISRLFAIEEDINKESTKIKLQSIATQILPKLKANIHNQAIMEFGALQCVPQNPNCNICDLSYHCEAFIQKKIKELPFKSKKVKSKVRNINFHLYIYENQVFMHKREKGDIWEGLFDFYDTTLNNDNLDICDKKIFLFSENVKHILTHQILMIEFSVFEIKNFNEIFVNKNNLVLLSYNEINQVGKPIVIYNFIEKNKHLIFKKDVSK